MGYQMGLSLQRPGMELDQEILVEALRDALRGDQPRLSRSQMDAAIAAQRDMLEGERRQEAEDNLAKGEAFLEDNAEREAVTETDSGLQYEVLDEGEGASPSGSDTVVVHYEGSLIDGTVFDSSYERDNPATLPLDGVIEGWQEGLQLMKEGAKYKFYIPAELGYGETGAGQRIGPNETLVFEVELLEVK
jgi:FKBP-type peptidyl-prolyl cis-trans isomerase